MYCFIKTKARVILERREPRRRRVHQTRTHTQTDILFPPLPPRAPSKPLLSMHLQILNMPSEFGDHPYLHYTAQLVQLLDKNKNMTETTATNAALSRCATTRRIHSDMRINHATSQKDPGAESTESSMLNTGRRCGAKARHNMQRSSPRLPKRRLKGSQLALRDSDRIDGTA